MTLKQLQLQEHKQKLSAIEENIGQAMRAAGGADSAILTKPLDGSVA